MTLNINIPKREEQKTTFSKVNYLRLTPGVPVRVRILQEDVVDVYKHFIQGKGISLNCPGTDCPICDRNSRLVKENPGKKFNEIKGVVPRQHRYLINVLNRTPVKRDSLGNVIYPNPNGQFSPTAPGGEIIVKNSIEPLNEVQVLEKGWTFFEKLLEKESSVTSGDVVYKTNAQGELVIENGLPVVETLPTVVGITHYDVILSSHGTPPNVETDIQVRPELNDELDYSTFELYDLNSLGIKLNPNEIEKVLAGVSLKDIYAARTATNSVETGEVETVVQERVDNLFDEIPF